VERALATSWTTSVSREAFFELRFSSRGVASITGRTRSKQAMFDTSRISNFAFCEGEKREGRART